MPDFYDWLKLLCKISKKNNYIWLIKPHPESYSQDIITIKKLIENYEKVLLIDKKYSNQEVLKCGIDIALTCFGTISFEYPYQDIKVINFSKNHPFKSYKFAFTPKNLKEYIKILNNLEKFDYSYDKNEIYEFYFLKRVFLDVDYMELKLDPMKDLNGYRLKERFFSTEYYNEWIKKWSINKHYKILKNIDNFISSNDFFTNNKHLS